MENKTCKGLNSLDFNKIMDNVCEMKRENLLWHKDIRCFPSVYEEMSNGNPCINIHLLPCVLPILSTEMDEYYSHFDNSHSPSEYFQKLKDCSDELVVFIMKHSWQFISVRSHYESVMSNMKTIVGENVPLDKLLKTVIESVVLVAVNEGFPDKLTECLYKFYIKEVKRLFDVELDLSVFMKSGV